MIVLECPVLSVWQNRAFQNNERKFYQQMGGDERKTYQQSDARETEEFWIKIWQPREHNKKAEQISNMTKELEELEEGSKVEIHIDLRKTTLKNIKLENAKAMMEYMDSDSRNLLPFTYDRLALEMNRCLQRAHVPEWMTKRKTTLIQKDPLKGTAPNNYRPITCLPMMWKILTAQIREEIYYSLTSRRLFSENQEGCRKGSRGPGELLYIVQHILNESKTRRENLAMAWIDNKKAYDIVQQSWIINCLKTYKIPDDVINFIKKTMKTWKMELTAGGRS